MKGKFPFWMAAALLLCCAASAPAETKTQTLFDGATLKGWDITRFGGEGEVQVVDKEIRIDMGVGLSGIHWTNAFPTNQYEISLEAKKIDGVDFFCGLTFPVGDSFLTLVVGGWGGAVVGLSNIDGHDASENETTKYLFLDKNRWYKVRVRVTTEKVEAWIDDEKVASVPRQGKRFELRPGGVELGKPLGITSWQTKAGIRNIRLKRL